MGSGLHVALGVTGGIAAFKVPTLVRLLTEEGAEVRCLLTKGALSFVSPLTLEVLSGNRVHQEEYLEATGSGVESHLELAQWADVFCVAPATAHTLSRLALGLADNFLCTAALAFTGVTILAPAMHANMWHHPAVQENTRLLAQRGVTFVGPMTGRLASGEHGEGRMAEPEAIAEAVLSACRTRDLEGLSVLVNAGPTQEPWDPVRFLGNRSSGRMGFAVAAAAARRGARVQLVAGPVSLTTPPGVERCDVTTAEEMEAAMVRLAPEAHLVFLAAAVADFRPRVVEEEKLKRREGLPVLELERTPDVLRSVKAAVRDDAYLVGFAAETGNLEGNAREKLLQKGVDAVVANDVSRKDIGFGSDENEVLVLREGQDPFLIARRPKTAVAEALLDLFSRAVKAQ